MKLAPVVALATIGLFLSTLAWSSKPPERDVRVPLDFTGIDTLVVDAYRPDIVLQYAALDTRLTHDPGPPMRVSREGSTLTIVQDDDDQVRDTVITAPRSLKRIVMRNGDIVAKAAVSTIDIEASKSMTWRGDVRELRIDHDPANTRCEDCRPEIGIREGKVDKLVLRTRSAWIEVNEAGRLGEATLVLGEDAKYDLEGLEGAPPPITVARYRDGPLVPTPTPSGTEAAAPAAEPPRTR